MTRREWPYLLCALGASLGLGCAGWAPPGADSLVNLAAGALPGPKARAPGTRTVAPSVSSSPATASRVTYAPDDAIRDALSGPLEVVGVGGWPGYFRRLSCVYRNAKVIVVDERCSDPREPTSLVVHVLSPTRGRATVFADASLPIGRARRPDYTSFGVAGAAARPPPASLAAMSYEDVAAYETDGRGEVRAGCSAGTQKPEGFCTKTSGTSAPEFASAVAPFVRAPPAAWYDLVRALVALRVQAHAAIRPASLPLPRLAAWGASWGRDQEVSVDEENMKRVGNGHGRSASIAVTRDGGALIAGILSRNGSAVPAVVRADASGARRWLTALPDAQFVSHEGASVLAVPDGAIVVSAGYPDPSWKPTARVIRLDDAGKVRWQWLGRGKDRYKIPIVVTAELTPGGTVHLRGYVQLVADGDVHGWTAELDGATGKRIREEIGPVLPDHAASFE
jgi:hypothetical protein